MIPRKNDKQGPVWSRRRLYLPPNHCVVAKPKKEIHNGRRTTHAAPTESVAAQHRDRLGTQAQAGAAAAPAALTANQAAAITEQPPC
jgi:hypothetical protein